MLPKSGVEIEIRLLAGHFVVIFHFGSEGARPNGSWGLDALQEGVGAHNQQSSGPLKIDKQTK